MRKELERMVVIERGNQYIDSQLYVTCDLVVTLRSQRDKGCCFKEVTFLKLPLWDPASELAVINAYGKKMHGKTTIGTQTKWSFNKVISVVRFSL